jgi:rod shape-determining protein MreB and related proteins
MTAFFSQTRRARVDVAIDFGTANMILAETQSGIVFNEPSLCCFVERAGRPHLYAAGSQAYAIRERVTGEQRVVRPLREGVMSDLDAGRELLRYAIRRSGKHSYFSRARAIVGVPADATQAERQALLTAVRDAGIGKAQLYDEPLMAAIGAGLDVEAPRGRMLIDCGAGTTEVAVISLGGICLSKSVRIGGDTLDEAIVDHLRARHRFEIGMRTAENVKLEIISLGNRAPGHIRIEIAGKSLDDGLPGRVSLTGTELTDVVGRHVERIVETVRLALAEITPELSRDILDDGVTLTGGSSAIALLSDSISAATGLEVRVADRSRDCVALGLSAVMRRG